MARLLELDDGRSRVGLVPDLGGGIAYFDALKADGAAPVLRGWDGSDRPFALACNVLVPFSNRIYGGGFPFEDRFFSVPCNIDGLEVPAHGDGFQRSWEVAHAGPAEARLRLPDGAIGPLRYDAVLDYRLEAGRLAYALIVTNSGPRLPFGGGFHPWLHRTAETRLAFAATGVWMTNALHVQTAHLGLSEASGWDFSEPRPLPDHQINTAYTGWQGRAVCDQPKQGLRVSIGAPDLDIAIVYAPWPDTGFLCFEPVSHAVDAANQPGQPGLVPLDTGQSLTLSMTIDWEAAPQGLGASAR